MIRQMLFRLSLILCIVPAIFKDRADHVAENIALRHQLSCTEDVAPGFGPSTVYSGRCSPASGVAGGKVWLCCETGQRSCLASQGL
jgi:hypothetical protein